MISNPTSGVQFLYLRYSMRISLSILSRPQTCFASSARVEEVRRSTELSVSMANMLAQSASRTAERLFQICVRAHRLLPARGYHLRRLSARCNHRRSGFCVRRTKWAYVMHLCRLFRLRGIVPEDAQYFFRRIALLAASAQRGCFPRFEGLIFGDPNGLTRERKGSEWACAADLRYESRRVARLSA